MSTRGINWLLWTLSVWTLWLLTLVFFVVESLVTDIYAIKTDRQFINTLEDQIWTQGAPLSSSETGHRLKSVTKSRKSCMLLH